MEKDSMATPLDARGALCEEGARGGEGRCPTTDSPPGAAVCPDGRASGGRRFYADIHGLVKNRKRKAHVYTVDGVRFNKARTLAEIPAEPGDELYVDVIPVELTDEFVEVLRGGVRVFRLRRTDLIAAFRKGLELPKNDENDVKVLSMIDRDCFVEVTVKYVELMKLIHEYNKQLNLLKLAKQFNASAEVVKLFERNKRQLARQIIRMAKITLNKYDVVCRQLGLSSDCRYGKVALADLLLHVDFTAGLRKILCYVGLYKPSNGRYNHRLRTALQSLAISYYGKAKVRAKEARQLLKKIKQTMARGPA